MKKYRTVMLMSALAFLASMASPATADAPQKSIFSFRGLTGQASWFDIQGCTLTSVQVIGVQNVTHDPGEGQPTETDQVSVFYTIFDFCTGAFRTGSGSGEGLVEGGLDALNIEGNIPVFDSQLGATIATVIISLEGSGDVTRGENNFQQVTPTSVIAVRSVGASTPATPAGVVVVDGVDLLDSVGGASGTISETNGGTVTIFRTTGQP